MADNDLRPIIVKRKKVIDAGGHHGGAWKVAMVSLSSFQRRAVFTPVQVRHRIVAPIETSF